MGFEQNKDGNIIAWPVLGYRTATVAGMAVLIQIRYAESEAELQTGGKPIQLMLTPPQAKEIAATLSRQADRAMNSATPVGTKN